jgi:DNA-binding transcriptional ArsR family regulator
MTQANLFDTSPARKPNVAHANATAEAREISYDKVKSARGKRHLLILAALAQYGPLTARQVLRALISQGHLPTTAERNQVSPRLSELAEADYIEALDELRTVDDDPPASVWKITQRGRLVLEQGEGRD